jgi:ribosomal protein S18 acetylase RimI-like enzyme
VSALEVRVLREEGVAPALALLRAVAAGPDGRFFTPHPFTEAVLGGLASAPGRDHYYLLMSGNEALAYGLLRGWNEGYDVPSVGLAVSPAARGRGLGRMMMAFLHAVARTQGAERVRLRVHPENGKAVSLYRSLGYSFEPSDSVTGLMVGLKDLTIR